MLPTYFDVIKQKSKKEPSVSEILDIIPEKIKFIWIKTSIPIVSDNRIKNMFTDYYSKYKSILKSVTNKKFKNFDKKCAEFKSHAEKTLFDISCCKCKSFSNCNCERSRKIPEREQSFLKDQRTVRKMVIGNVDLAVSKRNLKLEKRKSSREQYKKKQ